MSGEWISMGWSSRWRSRPGGGLQLCIRGARKANWAGLCVD
jgi:hypothetical protein